MCFCIVSHKWQYICVMFMNFFFLHVSHRSFQQRVHPQEFPHSQYKHPSMATQPKMIWYSSSLMCSPRNMTQLWKPGPNLESYWPISDLTQCTVLSVPQLKARMPSVRTDCVPSQAVIRASSKSAQSLALSEAEREVVVFSNIFWWGSEDDLAR